MSDEQALKLKPIHDISAFCEVEASRYSLAEIHYDGERKEIVATDSRAIAIVPVPNGPDETFRMPWWFVKDSVSLYRDVKKRTFSGARSSLEIVVSRDGSRFTSTVGDDTHSAVHKSEGMFPDYAALIPQDAPKATIRIDARLLLKIAEHAIANADRDAYPTLSIEAREQDMPVVVKLIGEDHGRVLATYVVAQLKED